MGPLSRYLNRLGCTGNHHFGTRLAFHQTVGRNNPGRRDRTGGVKLSNSGDTHLIIDAVGEYCCGWEALLLQQPVRLSYVNRSA